MSPSRCRHAQTIVRGLERSAYGLEGLSMTSLKTSIAFAAIAAAIAGYAALPVRAGGVSAPAATIAPLKAKTFDMGGKRVIAYYENAAEACKVTVLVSDHLEDTGPVPTSAVRFNSTVAAGTSTRVETSEGPSLAVTCAANAANLSVEPLSRVAYQAPVRK